MSSKDKELFSVDNEIAVHSEIPHEPASEKNPQAETEGTPASSDSYYLSVAFE